MEVIYLKHPTQLLAHRSKLLQLRLTLHNTTDPSPPSSSIHGILQARILEWVAMPSSRGSSSPRDRTLLPCLLYWQVNSLPLVPPGKPSWHIMDTQYLNISFPIFQSGKKNHRERFSLRKMLLEECVSMVSGLSSGSSHI